MIYGVVVDLDLAAIAGILPCNLISLKRCTLKMDDNQAVFVMAVLRHDAFLSVECQ